MSNLFQSLAKSSLIAVLAVAPLFAHADTVTWRGQTITYSGAEVKTVGNDELLLIYKNTSGENTLTLPAVDINARILAVGGGGAGGTTANSRNRAGGGGGAGEFVDRDGITFNNQTLSIFVGAGGAAPAGKAAVNGNPGDPSYIQIGGVDYLRVNGGGGGGSAAGQPGGSGGGAGFSGSASNGGASDKENADGFGNAGGASVSGYGGGGGGASSNGDPGVSGVAGKGGSGKVSDITGEEVLYAGGGGGGSANIAGAAGGGAGAGSGGGLDDYGNDILATPGDPNTGSGGGGAGRYTIGAAGGSGVIIIRLTGIVKPLEWVALTGLPQGWSKIEVATEPKVEWKNGELLLTYTNVADACGFRVPEGLVQARALVIGGGGAGGTGYKSTSGFAGPGGGGAGGFVEAQEIVMSGEYKIIVGAGGAAATTADIATGKPGADGSFSQITPNAAIDPFFYQGDRADGGGGGGAWHNNGDGTFSNGNGRDGASGGGGAESKATSSTAAVTQGQPGKGIAGQGHDGALGNQLNVGGGGGGAGQEAPEISASSALGGNGLTSDITGESVWYAGGGGGSRKDSNFQTYTGGLGGGGQGFGGAAQDPDGKRHGKDGFGGGGGGGNQVLPGGKGGDGVVIIRIKACVPFVVPVPTGHEFIYDGTEKQGVDDSVAYKQSGEDKRTNADNYHTILVIDPSLPDMVRWGDTTGGRGERSIPWAIHPLEVDVPVVVKTKFVFDDNEHVAVAGVDGAGYCSTNVVAGVPLNFCRLTDYKLVNACRTNFVATLCNYYDVTPNVTNFIWRVDGLDPVKVPWSIAQATNEVTLLTLGSWQEGTTAATPNSRWKWDTVTKKYPHPDEVTYQYRVEGTTAWSEAKTAAAFQADLQALEANAYELRCYICADSNHPAPHEGGNWCHAEKVIRFYVWRHPAETFTDYVDVIVSGNTSASTLSDFPVLVRLKEPVDGGRGGGLPGFTYARAGASGSEIRFVSLANTDDYAKPDAERDRTTDRLLPYEVDSWNPKGESLVWVKVPSVSGNTTKFRLYWRRKDGGKVTPDILPQEVWSAYTAVWHMNVTEGTYVDSVGGVIATGPVEVASSPMIGNAVYAPAAQHLIVGDYREKIGTASPFLFTGWYRGDTYTGSGNYSFAGTKPGKDWNFTQGWSFFMNNSKTVVGASASSGTWSNGVTVPDVTKTWQHLAYQSPASGNTRTFIANGASKKNFNSVLNESTLPVTLVSGNFAVDEVRVMKKLPTNVDAWVKAERDSVADENFCTFGLVSQEQFDKTRAWVNWWTKEPDVKRYWDKGELDEAAWYAGSLAGAYRGALFAGVVTNKFVRMPEDRDVPFPEPWEKASYTVEFYQFDAAGTAGYPGKHVLYDGTRIFDFEVVEHDPQPIDPDGPEGATRSGRVLTANDDTNRVVVAEREEEAGVALQAYWRTRTADETLNPFWEHEPGEPPALGVNLLQGSVHTLRHIVTEGEGKAVTNDLWTLRDVFVGNLMTNDATVAEGQMLSNRWNTLPWSPTSKANRAKDAPFDFREAGQMVMRNLADAENAEKCAMIRSGVYTNGIGTVYFDAVNAYAGADVSTNWYRLKVEVARPGSELWEPVKLLPLLVSAGVVTTNEAAAGLTELQCLNVQNGGKTAVADARFCRVCAKVDRREPLRFRIRRTSVRSDGTGAPTGPNDPDGFILIDNVIASWPAAKPALEPTGSYDPSRFELHAPVLGVEGAFSVAYPSVNDKVDAKVRVTGGEAKNVASARIHYRWRHADKAFDPPQLSEAGTWRVTFLRYDEENGIFTTVSPLAYRALPGDVEYYYDMTAFVPYYEYRDYSGCGLEQKMKACCGEEPEKYSVRRSRYFEETGGKRYPSNGTDWFVRLREFPNAKRGWTLYAKTSEKAGAPVTVRPLEMLGTNEWRACLATTAAVEKVWFRLESERPEGSQVQALHTATNYWTASSADTLLPPCHPALQAAPAAGEWSTVRCDAKTGYLMFLVDEAKANVTVARADWQDFNRWSSAVTNLFVGSVVDTNVTSTLTNERNAPIATWPASKATDENWTEDFKVDGGQVAALIYPRNRPFQTQRTARGWTAENAMWTWGRWSRQNAIDPAVSYGDDSALQLEGCGRGSLTFAGNSVMPDGLDTVTYKARVAQYNTFNDFCYYNTYLIEYDELHQIKDVQMTVDLTDYTFVTKAALTTRGEGSYSGDGSVSLVAYYDQRYGCYEFRVSRSSTETGVRLALFRWRMQGGTKVCEELMSKVESGKQRSYFDFGDEADVSKRNMANATRLVKDELLVLGQLFLSVKGEGAKTRVTAGLCKNDVPAKSDPSSGGTYVCLTYLDNDAAKRLKNGTFGVLARNCPGVFTCPVFYRSPVGTLTASDGVVTPLDNQTVVFPETQNKCENAHWFAETGRTEPLPDDVGCRGLRAAAPLPQQVLLELSESGKNDWKPFVTNTVDAFTDETYPVLVRDTRALDVRLRPLGTTTDARTDVTVNEIELTQWNGQWSRGKKVGGGWQYHGDEFDYMTAWLADDAYGNRAARLQPARAPGRSTPVALRTPLMRGLGLIHLRWRNADPHAKLLVQVNEVATDTNLGTLSEASPSSSNWETVGTLDFGELGPAGSTTVYVNRRYDGWDYRGADYYKGLIRLVVAEEVTAEALEVLKADPLYGSVEIAEAFAWELPEYDKRSWSGWNFRAAGWTNLERDKSGYGTPDEWANLTDAFNGLSGLLNNTLDESTLADHDKRHYDQNPPHVQSPPFQTNCIGAVSFRARLYADTGRAAVVTVYGNPYLDAKTGEPVPGCWTRVADVQVTNLVYTTFRVKLGLADDYKAIRLGVRGVVPGEEPVANPERVALDDICVWERSTQSIRFHPLRTRPFRDSNAIRAKTAVADIASPEEQPLTGEAFGFQAEVEVENPEEIETEDPTKPVRVELWYYPSAEPWGFSNWSNRAEAVRVVLKPAEGTNLVFRSTLDRATSLCPPQLLAKGETHRFVQYHLIAHFYERGATEPAKPHHLGREDWAMPSWYEGLQNPNDNAPFSAFTVLDGLLPGRAWINEINYSGATQAKAAKSQWLELAVPLGVDMTGWQVYVYSYDSATAGGRQAYLGDGPLFEIGRGDAKVTAKTASDAPLTHYGFLTVGAPGATDVVTDNRWYPTTERTGCLNEGTLDYERPFGFELRRPSGIVEHRVVAEGQSQNYAEYWYDYQYTGTNLVAELKRAVGGSWVFAGKEPEDDVSGLSVTNGQGKAETDWTAAPLTLGLLNEGQVIDPNWYQGPNGDYVSVYAQCFSPYLRQIINGSTNTSDIITLTTGGTTNILYEVDNFYELSELSVKSEHAPYRLTGPVRRNGRSYYDLCIYDISNRTDVAASADIAQGLRDRGVTPDNPYTPAIMKWLRDGVTRDASGNEVPFAGDEVQDFVYRYCNGAKPTAVTTNLSLKVAYWLDVDPTQAGWELMGNMGDTTGGGLGPLVGEVKRRRPGETLVHSNSYVTMWMELTNAVTGAAHPPWRLQGLGNERSDAPSTYSGGWSSVTFKVRGQLLGASGLPISNRKCPMRYLVFDRNSFLPQSDGVAPFSARVEIVDPFSKQSPAYDRGWNAWKGLYTVGYSWGLDESLMPGGVSTMKAEDSLEDAYGPEVDE